MGRAVYANRRDLEGFLGTVMDEVDRPGRLYLTAATSQLFDGLVDRVERFVFAHGPEEANRAALEDAVDRASLQRKLDVAWDSPGDIVPLPDDYAARERPTGMERAVPGGRVVVLHFDPYSVTCRLIARGDEPDYRAALTYLRHGWLDFGRLDTVLDELLPRFTAETIAQDPAEFRRKLKGLRQMWRAEQGRTSRPATAAHG